MRPVVTVVLTIEPGTPRYGLWCTDCMLPSGAAVDVWSLRPTCLIRLGMARRCMDCGGENVELEA